MGTIVEYVGGPECGRRDPFPGKPPPLIRLNHYSQHNSVYHIRLKDNLPVKRIISAKPRAFECYMYDFKGWE